MAITVPGGRLSIVERGSVMSQDYNTADKMAEQWAEISNLTYVAKEEQHVKTEFAV
jgi:hypothetical protein